MADGAGHLERGRTRESVAADNTLKMTGKATIRFGGWSLIVGAVAFMAIFAYLASQFDYPDVLDGPAETVLPGLLGTGSTGRAVWAIYAFLPLIWIPAGVGAAALEVAGRLLGTYDHYVAGRSHAVWDIAVTTKDVKEHH